MPISRSTAEQVQVVERPIVERVNIITADHARTDEGAQSLDADIACLEEEVADGRVQFEVPRVVKDWARYRQGDHDRGIDTGAVPVVLSPQFGLRVVALVHTSAARHDIGVCARPTLAVGGSDHAAVGAKLKRPLVRLLDRDRR